VRASIWFLLFFGVSSLTAVQESFLREGLVRGILNAKGEAWVEVKNDNGYLHRYLAPWHGDGPSKGGGFDPATLARIKQLVVGNRVNVTWFLDGHLRLISVEHEMPEEQGGIFEGYVLEVGDRWIDAQNKDEGKPRRFYLKWNGGYPENGGGYDLEVLEELKNHEPTNPIRFHWSFDLRPRIDRVLTFEEVERRAFYDLDEVPPWLALPTPFEIEKPPKRDVLNPFDAVTAPPGGNPFDSVPSKNANPFDSVPTANPFEQADKKASPVNPFDATSKEKPQPPANPFDAVGEKKAANPFENLPLPNNPFDSTEK
tara:strand:+ start:1100 stop:2038 length:939 start_codon:yes stop_codon:yes gene_type:complete